MARSPVKITSCWQFWIDRGGTFTDIVAKTPTGELISHKLLSANPEKYADAALQGMRDVLDVPADASLPTERIAQVKMGTTVATNALLEKRGEPVALVITQGFADALEIGYQARPDIFALNIQKPQPLYQQVIEARERVLADGHIDQPLDAAQLTADLTQAFKNGLRACAIVFMHSTHYPKHEQQAATIAREVGFTQISASHQVSPQMGLIGRADTTVVDAYLSPVLHRYAQQVAAALGDTQLLFMKSDGGLAKKEFFAGKDAILSGPAGGMVACARTAQAAGFDHVIGFDMGGTSTDVSHFAGEFEHSYETVVAGVRLRTPMLQIHTVAAGGGSVVHFADGRYQVGPDSAGANPGPACYRRGGPLTVTDCNVMLGKLQPDFFPAVFGTNADQPLDVDVVKQRFTQLAAQIQQATGDDREPVAVAAGFLRIAVENMAHAIRKISVQRGHDVTHYALNCFGGAGGQHACLVADALGISQVLIHPLGGVLSAYGMGLADVSARREAPVNAPLNNELLGPLNRQITQLTQAAKDELLAQGCAEETLTTAVKLHLKYQGTNTTLDIDWAELGAMEQAFSQAHKSQFGFIMPRRELVVELLSIEATSHQTTAAADNRGRLNTTAPTAVATAAVYMADAWQQAAIYRREDLVAGQRLSGPAIIQDPVSTIVVEPHWQLQVNAQNQIILQRPAKPQLKPKQLAQSNKSAAIDPVLLEVFNNRFMAVAEQMGTMLQKTAYSANVKERLDFSCALFDAQANLIANAPHIPVHLGSMGDSVQAIVKQRADTMQPGDVFMLNNPYAGGTHLPDITVVTPVFNAAGTQVIFYVASRAHHADVGGVTPGSMPPNSQNIEQEGVLIENFQLVKNGQLQEAAVTQLFSQGQWPARSVADNLSDLRAQVAANEKGVQALLEMVQHYGLAVVHAYMRHVQDNAEAQVRQAIQGLTSGQIRYPLDNGAAICVAVQPQGDTITVDFSGTSAQQASNFNAPESVTRAAVLYVLRTLVDSDIPLNSGCLRPVNIIIPKGSMLSPNYPAAVVAGNVEVSQAVTNALYLALGKLAASQGTMNNFTFGNVHIQHYETICGGAGAGHGFAGADAVQTHMTNSRLTDPEVLEWRFPVVLEAFSIRANSGGQGQWQGGNGVERRLRFLQPMTAAILANMRHHAPQGLAGGQAGQTGRQWIERADGHIQPLAEVDQAKVSTGDVFVIQTPGGGGCGRKS